MLLLGYKRTYFNFNWYLLTNSSKFYFKITLIENTLFYNSTESFMCIVS